MSKGIAIVLVLTALTACGTLDGTKVRQELGLVGQPPDEFMVTTRRPLQMPQSTNQLVLPTPMPGTQNRVEIDPMQQASLALFGQAAPQDADFRTLSETEQALLEKTQATDGDMTLDIRETLEDEAGNANRDDYLIYKLFPSLKAPGDRDDTIDARAEAERLRGEEGGSVPVSPSLPIPRNGRSE